MMEEIVVFQLSGSPVSKSYNLIINGTGTKTLDGSSKIYGDLALSASDFDLNETQYIQKQYYKNLWKFDRQCIK